MGVRLKSPLPVFHKSHLENLISVVVGMALVAERFPRPVYDSSVGEAGSITECLRTSVHSLQNG